MTIDKTEIMVSLDVTSLFTNMPLDVALDGLVGRWDSIKSVTNIPKSEFINAVKFVLTSTYFTFNGIIYKQTFDAPMGFLLYLIFHYHGGFRRESVKFFTISDFCILDMLIMSL